MWEEKVLQKFLRSYNVMIFLEAASGFEPLHKGFADLSLSHLGTPPDKQ